MANWTGVKGVRFQSRLPLPEGVTTAIGIFRVDHRRKVHQGVTTVDACTSSSSIFTVDTGSRSGLVAPRLAWGWLTLWLTRPRKTDKNGPGT